jgi:hypothetical protein
MKVLTAERSAFCDPSHGVGDFVAAYGVVTGKSRTADGFVATARAQSKELFEPVGRPGKGFAGYIDVAGANPLVPGPDIDLRLNYKDPERGRSAAPGGKPRRGSISECRGIRSRCGWQGNPAG